MAFNTEMNQHLIATLPRTQLEIIPYWAGPCLIFERLQTLKRINDIKNSLTCCHHAVRAIADTHLPPYEPKTAISPQVKAIFNIVGFVVNGYHQRSCGWTACLAWSRVRIARQIHTPMSWWVGLHLLGETSRKFKTASAFFVALLLLFSVPFDQQVLFL